MTNAREELRAAEERIAQLREENATLQRQVVKPTGLRNWTIAALLAAGLTGASGFVVADRAGRDRTTRELESGAREHSRRLDEQVAATVACKLSVQKATLEFATCEEARSRTRPPPSAPSPRPPPRQPPCACEAGDPLCSCL
jgi:hypothetical protein